MKRFTGHTEPWGTFLDVKNWNLKEAIAQKEAADAAQDDEEEAPDEA